MKRIALMRRRGEIGARRSKEENPKTQIPLFSSAPSVLPPPLCPIYP